MKLPECCKAGTFRASSKVFAQADCAHFSPKLSTPSSQTVARAKMEEFESQSAGRLEDLSIFRRHNGVDLRAQDLSAGRATCLLLPHQCEEILLGPPCWHLDAILLERAISMKRNSAVQRRLPT